MIQVLGAGNVRGYLNNNEIGRTSGSGNLLVPNLLSYYGNRLSISDRDLPADYRVEGGEHVVATPIAREGEFEFECLSFGAHPARVEYADGVCDFVLIVLERVGAVSELGTVVCALP